MYHLTFCYSNSDSNKCLCVFNYFIVNIFCFSSIVLFPPTNNNIIDTVFYIIESTINSILV